MLVKFTLSEFNEPVFISHTDISVVGPQLEYLDGNTPTRDGTTKIILSNETSYIVKESPEEVAETVNNAFKKGIII